MSLALEPRTKKYTHQGGAGRVVPATLSRQFQLESSCGFLVRWCGSLRCRVPPSCPWPLARPW
eukprot:7356014-Pyramimonas_sp.AAC.1